MPYTVTNARGQTFVHTNLRVEKELYERVLKFVALKLKEDPLIKVSVTRVIHEALKMYLDKNKS